MLHPVVKSRSSTENTGQYSPGPMLDLLAQDKNLFEPNGAGEARQLRQGVTLELVLEESGYI